MKKIVVDCERNDLEDIRCGGPQYLGFDFFIKDEEAEELKQVVMQELRNNEIPYISISIENVPKIETWGKEEIIKCIKQGYK